MDSHTCLELENPFTQELGGPVNAGKHECKSAGLMRVSMLMKDSHMVPDTHMVTGEANASLVVAATSCISYGHMPPEGRTCWYVKHINVSHTEEADLVKGSLSRTW